MKFLLDTHVLLWWFEERSLSPKHRKIIRRASADNPLWVSDITL